MPYATPFRHTADNITESLSEYVDIDIATLLGHKITEAFYSADYIGDFYNSSSKHYSSISTGFSKCLHLSYRFTVAGISPVIPTVFLYYTTNTSRIRISHNLRLLRDGYEGESEEYLDHQALLQSATTEPSIIFEADLHTIDFDRLKHSLIVFNPYNACAEYINALFDHYYTTLYFRTYLLRISNALHLAGGWTVCQNHGKILLKKIGKLKMSDSDVSTLMQEINQCNDCNHRLDKYAQSVSSLLTPRNKKLHDIILAKLNPTPADRATGCEVPSIIKERILVGR